VVVAGLAIWLLLLVLAGVLLAAGLLTLVLAPILAGRLAATASRPKLERRASGPDRMRALIDAQRTERRRRGSLSVGLKRLAAGLFGGAIACLVAAGVLALTGGA
jgi:hypothetical protein